MSGAIDPAPAVPRPAASLLLVRDDPLEVLMVRRHARATFASALVFPGGTVDAADADENWLPLVEGADALDTAARALRIAALRETWEEAAVLLTTGGAVGRAPAAGADFMAHVRASGGRLALGEVVPFGHWVTPAAAPKRYDTHFFLCAAPAGIEALCDGQETVALEWARPADLLARFEDGERSILFPTRMNLKRLAESDDAAAAIARARAQSPYRVEPEIVRHDGGIILLIPADAGYGVTEDHHPLLN